MYQIKLLPQPRYISPHHGNFTFAEGKLILLDIPEPRRLLDALTRFKKTLFDRTGCQWTITASSTVPQENIGLLLQIRPDLIGFPQGYRLSIQPERISIFGHDLAGLFYALCTLRQFLYASDLPKIQHLPAVDVVDWPDFPARGIMLDISRDKVPTMETLFNLVDLLASLKINQFQLYMEHTFAYQQHPEVWKDASPITGEEILELDRYCQERFIELVPNQNSFGHLHRWFEHPKYAPLGELYGLDIPHWWGKTSFSLCPVNPESFSFVKSLYDELLPHFSSRMVNIGCDETFDLGLGHSKSAVETMGKGQVYLDFLLKLYTEISRRNRTVQFWGDIILQHPDLVPQLPRDIIALEWGYEAEHPFDERTAKFAQSGIPFYVCPGTSAWNSIAGRTDNALQNLGNAARAGLSHGAIGYLNTDWGDNGHWQVLPISYLGYAAGAALSWNYQANQDTQWSNVLDRYIFHDSGEGLGKAALALGNVYQVLGIQAINSSVLFNILQTPISALRQYEAGLSLNAFDQLDQAIKEASSSLNRAAPNTPDAELLKREFRLTVRMLEHASMRGKFVISPTDSLRGKLLEDIHEIVTEYQSIWLARNRPGGLKDSLARFEIARKDYLTT